jgi:uncharacterized protein (TIGR02453 family)
MDFAALVTYLAELNLNNNKPWFDAHRPTYEQLRADWLAFVGEVIAGISQFDPSVAIVSAKDSQFRIHRDVRFSKDKRPYKTAFSAAISPQGKNSGLPAYYFHVDEAAKLLIAGGVYMPEAGRLNQIRKYIAEHPERLESVLADPEFQATYGGIDAERLKRPPQGYDETTPGIEWIKLKSFTAWTEPRGWLARQAGLADEMVGGFRELFPLIRWLREALTGSSEIETLSPEDIDRLARSGG